MRLLYSNCIPILTYGCQVKQYAATDMRKLNTAVNDSIHKIFGWNRWESVRTLREMMGYRSIYEIFERQSHKFLVDCYLADNTVLSHLIVNFHPDSLR